jgi:hypothetical protein
VELDAARWRVGKVTDMGIFPVEKNEHCLFFLIGTELWMTAPSLSVSLSKNERSRKTPESAITRRRRQRLSAQHSGHW